MISVQSIVTIFWKRRAYGQTPGAPMGTSSSTPVEVSEETAQTPLIQKDSETGRLKFVG